MPAMRRLADALYDIALTLWVGGLWVVGLLVAPALFSVLAADRQLAGLIAGRLFFLIGWTGLGCASYLLLFTLLRAPANATARRWTLALLLGMALLTAVNLFAIQPLLAQLKADAASGGATAAIAAERFATWHGASAILYLLQSLLGLLLISVFRRGNH